MSVMLYKVTMFACGVIFTLFGTQNVCNGPVKKTIK